MNLFKIDKYLYPKVTLVKAVHQFLNDYYIFLDTDEKGYLVNWQPKEDNLKDSKFELEFKNELLTQLIRYEVFQQTKTIRQLTLARAFASSMYSTSQIGDGQETADFSSNFNIDTVLSEWNNDDNG